VLTAIAQGGNADLSVTSAVAAGRGYAAIGTAGAAMVFIRRDITD